jgi:hypothetical protein
MRKRLICFNFNPFTGIINLDLVYEIVLANLIPNTEYVLYITYKHNGNTVEENIKFKWPMSDMDSSVLSLYLNLNKNIRDFIEEFKFFDDSIIFECDEDIIVEIDYAIVGNNSF